MLVEMRSQTRVNHNQTKCERLLASIGINILPCSKIFASAGTHHSLVHTLGALPRKRLAQRTLRKIGPGSARTTKSAINQRFAREIHGKSSAFGRALIATYLASWLGCQAISHFYGISLCSAQLHTHAILAKWQLLRESERKRGNVSLFEKIQIRMNSKTSSGVEAAIKTAEEKDVSPWRNISEDEYSRRSGIAKYESFHV